MFNKISRPSVGSYQPSEFLTVIAQVQEIQYRLRPIIEDIFLFGRQNIPLRGHRDNGYLSEQNLMSAESVSSVSDNRNFSELLRFRVAAGDTKLENHLKNISAIN